MVSLSHVNFTQGNPFTGDVFFCLAVLHLSQLILYSSPSEVIVVTIYCEAKANQELGVEDLEKENGQKSQRKIREDGLQILPQQRIRLDSFLTVREC